MRRVAICISLAALLAGQAQAAETPARELQMLGRCALASSVYRSLMPPAPNAVQPTDADSALYERMKLAEPALRARADKIAGDVEPSLRDGIAAELRTQFQAQMAPVDGPRKSPREALDLYAPILESCIARADLIAAE